MGLNSVIWIQLTAFSHVYTLVVVITLTPDDSKVKAHVMLGQLKEAYLIAVKSGNKREIEKIRDEAEQSNNTRVVNLATSYLSQLEED